jgi:hypothetical protein
MVSGFSGSGVSETSAVEVDGFGVVLTRSASFHAVRPGQLCHDICRRRRRRIVEGLPGLAYVRRRVVPLPSRNCTSVLLVFVTGDWTVLYSFPLSLSLLT